MFILLTAYYVNEVLLIAKNRSYKSIYSNYISYSTAKFLLTAMVILVSTYSQLKYIQKQFTSFTAITNNNIYKRNSTYKRN